MKLTRKNAVIITILEDQRDCWEMIFTRIPLMDMVGIVLYVANNNCLPLFENPAQMVHADLLGEMTVEILLAIAAEGSQFVSRE